MQMRIINNHPSGPFNNVVTHQIRHSRHQPIFAYQGKETPQNIYYEMNPYLLHHNPLEQPRNLIVSKSRNSA